MLIYRVISQEDRHDFKTHCYYSLQNGCQIDKELNNKLMLDIIHDLIFIHTFRHFVSDSIMNDIHFD